MKTSAILLATCILTFGSDRKIFAQATPAATSTPTVPTLNTATAVDQLSYTVGVSEDILFGYYGQNGLSTSTNVFGTAGYVSGSQSRPTSFLYSGGYLSGNNGQPSSTYQDFGISQGFNTQHFSFVFGDQVSYLPSAPVFGLSGVAGVGDVGTQPIGTGTAPVDSVLTDFGQRVTNTVSGSVTDRFTGSTSLNAFANFTLQRFPGDDGINNEDVEVGASLNHRFDARNILGAGYVYSEFTYQSGENLSINTQVADVQFQHTISEKLLLSASAGPEWTTSSNTALFPSSINFAADVSLFYTAKRNRYLLAYTRGTTTGDGVLLGTESNNVNFTVQRSFDQNWSGGFSANYGHTSSLESTGGTSSTASTFYTGVQVSRRLGREFSAYASYNLQVQSISGPLLVNAFSGTSDVIGVGVTYAPRPLRMGHH